MHYKLKHHFSLFFFSSSSSILWIKARKATSQSDYTQIGFATSFFFFYYFFFFRDTQKTGTRVSVGSSFLFFQGKASAVQQKQESSVALYPNGSISIEYGTYVVVGGSLSFPVYGPRCPNQR